MIRYEKTLPGEMIHIDKKLGRIEGVGHRITGNRTGQSAPRSRKQGGKGWEYLHLAVDDHSRLAYSEILPDETRRSCLKFLFNALRFDRDHGVRVLRVMTDNGVSFRSRRYTKALRMLKIKPKRTTPYTQEPTERPNASCRPPCGNGPTPNHTIIHPNGPPHCCLSSTIIIIIGLTSASTEDPLSQGSPSITYRDATARARRGIRPCVPSQPNSMATLIAVPCSGKAPAPSGRKDAAGEPREDVRPGRARRPAGEAGAPARQAAGLRDTLIISA